MFLSSFPSPVWCQQWWSSHVSCFIHEFPMYHQTISNTYVSCLNQVESWISVMKHVLSFMGQFDSTVSCLSQKYPIMNWGQHESQTSHLWISDISHVSWVVGSPGGGDSERWREAQNVGGGMEDEEHEFWLIYCQSMANLWFWYFWSWNWESICSKYQHHVLTIKLYMMVSILIMIDNGS